MQTKLEDTLYKVDKRVEKLSETWMGKMTDFEQRLKIRQAESPLEVNEEWHAELTKDALSSVEKL